jgi:hypothetical protein
MAAMPGRGVREGRVAAVVVALVVAVVMACAGTATARQPFRPRIGNAMGIEPLRGADDNAGGSPGVPAAYHGGSVMRNVTIHTVFWAPAGYHFDGAPGGGVLGYQALIQQFFADVAHDSGDASNIFSTLDQYGDRSGVGTYSLHYDAAADSVVDADPYPPPSRGCASPSGVATCVTDPQVQREVDKLIGAQDPAGRGLTNVWFVLLPPDVDECISVGSCATTAFAGYHSEFDLGQGLTIYSAIPDPQIEFTPPPGSDPEGNPEAEETIDTMAHETIEAATNPVGNAWMDPNGFEVADKCENGPQQGTPLGYAADGSPFNQLIDGHEYLIQDSWSNSRGGCVQSSATVAATPALHTVSLRQFSPAVSGSTGVPGTVPVTVGLVRGNRAVAVALAQTRTRPDGSWGPATLRGASGAPHAVGDDRDTLEVFYGFARTSPAPDLIATGDGGNPFTESGWTGWYDLDHGYAVHRTGAGATITTAPCSQTGVQSLAVGPALTESPAELCSTAADDAVVRVARLRAATPVTFTSEDNRGEYGSRPDGTLVRLTVTLGEPDSVSAVANGQVSFTPTGFPTCAAFERIRAVRCSGLVPHEGYRLLRDGRAVSRGQAGNAGAVTVTGLAVHGGDVLTLVNGAGRRLTSLHVAHLRVDLIGNQTVVASGTCQAGDYWGPPVSRLPVSSAVGTGIGGSGTICPVSGRAGGLPAAEIAQADDFSGGQTVIQVPEIESTAPNQDETLYGAFVASAQSGLPGPHGSVSANGVPVALTITPAGSRHGVFHARDVDTARGVDVPALAPGPYVATWVLHDAAGDTRTVTTRFTDEP